MNIKQVNDFINNELKEYARYDNSRSLPSMVDGLKTSQRKVIYTVFEALKTGVAIKTASLGAKASDLTHYKHGEASIIDTVIGLAKDYAGSNNYPLLLKDGQFGTVIDNSSSSPRYIFVKRYDKLDTMFDKDDRDIVEYLEFDGEKIEPIYYLPKLPVILLNGSLGIGNGYSCTILNRDVDSIKKYIVAKLNNKKVDSKLLLPSFNSFTGKVVQLEKNQFDIYGRIERVNTTTTIIKDLPPSSKYQYDKYKERVLLPLLVDSKSGLKDIVNDSNEELGWNIKLQHTREFIDGLSDEEILRKLKLVEKVTENITVWDFNNKLKVFNSANDLLDDWIEQRLLWIEKRKIHQLKKIAEKQEWFESLLKLINYWLENDLSKIKKVDLIERLKTVVNNQHYVEKFLEQNISSLTLERVEKLKKDVILLNKEYTILSDKTIEIIFKEDLANI